MVEYIRIFIGSIYAYKAIKLQIMSDFVLKWYIRLFDMLSIKHKLELILRLTERLKDSYDSDQSGEDELEREKALNELMDSWQNADIDGDFIVNNRTVPHKVYDLWRL